MCCSSQRRRRNKDGSVLVNALVVACNTRMRDGNGSEHRKGTQLTFFSQRNPSRHVLRQCTLHVSVASSVLFQHVAVKA